MPTSNLIGRIRFIPVHRSKAILVLAPPEYMDDIRQMVEELDKPAKQVLIKAVIVQADHSEMTSLGLKLSYGATEISKITGSSALVEILAELTSLETYGAWTLSTTTSVDALVDFQIENGITGILAVGTTGESPVLSWEEHKRVVDNIAKKTKNKCVCIAGAGSNDTKKTLAAARHGVDAGADALLLVTEPSIFGLHDLALAIELGELMRLPMGVVVNRARPEAHDVTALCAAAEVPLLGEIPFDRQAAEVHARGRLLVDAHPSGAAWFEDLWLATSEQLLSPTDAVIA